MPEIMIKNSKKQSEIERQNKKEAGSQPTTTAEEENLL